MKGMSETLVIIITIVVILVAALVILTVFGDQLGKIFQGQGVQYCVSQCKQLCLTSGQDTGQPPGYASITGCADVTCDCSQV